MPPMPLSDADALHDLLRARHAAVYVPTYEEEHALDVVRAVAADRKRHFLIWTVTRGLRDGMIEDEATIPDTAHPAGAMTHLALHAPANSMIAMLDLAGHLADERTLR